MATTTTLTTPLASGTIELVDELTNGPERISAAAAVTLAAAAFDTTTNAVWELIVASGRSGVWNAAARDDSTPPETLDAIVTHAVSRAREGDALITAHAAARPGLSETVRARLAAHPEAVVRCATAESVHTPAALLAALATDTDLDVCEAVADNPNCDHATLMQLTRHEHSDVRIAVADVAARAGHIDILDILCNDESQHVRAVVADITRTVRHLEQLTNDDCDDVRRAVALNRETPPKLLATLADDSHPFVASAARRTL